MINCLSVGLVYLGLGLIILYYQNKRRIIYKEYRSKLYMDYKGFIAGFAGVVYGLYLIFKFLINNYK
jgi:uncharacterized protein HemY